MTDTQDHICGQLSSDGSVVSEVHGDLLNTDDAATLAELFRTLGDPNRLRIISVLMHHELCVHDITELVELSQSAVSHQLRVLRQMRLVRTRKEGRNVYYALDDDHVRELFRLSLEHISH
ncbi:MAG TPA: metalloregulator ArsR/SmtB family transcription factor [Bellilinea sp.]|nr:metalloregulator ArsR/SmtB family transcription factor [Bellilinea sp.]